MAFLNNQHEGGIPSECETGTRALIHSANCCVQIQPAVGIAPSRPGARLPRIGGIVPATDSIVLIACLFVGDMPWRYSVGCPTACRVLG
jgi:hypothetical protein